MIWIGATIENYNNSNQYLGDFKLTPYLNNCYNNDINKGFNTLVKQSQSLIDSYLGYALTKHPFNTLLPLQKQLLLEALFYQINHILYNVLPIERTEDQSVSIPNSTSISLQIKQYIYSTDALSTRTKELCEATGLRYDELNKEKYVESRITYLPDINATYNISDLFNLNCNYYYIIPNKNGIPNLDLLNYKRDNAISAFLYKTDDYIYRLTILYYVDVKNKVEAIIDSFLFINTDKNPIHIGDDGAKWNNGTQGTSYYPDNQTITMSTDNKFTAIGIKNGDDVINAENIKDISNKVDKNITDIKSNSSNIQKNTENIQKNTTNIDNLNKIIVDKSKLKDELISTDPENNLIMGSDKKLFVKDGGGGGETYYGDGKTTEIDSKNTISAIGLKLTDNNYIKADDIAEDLKQVADNKTNISTLSGQVEEDIKNIGKNKEDIDSLKTGKLGVSELDSKSIIKSNAGRYYALSLSKPRAQTYYGIDDIMNKDNLSDFVDTAREDNILQVEGSKLVVIAPKTKWKLVMKPEDFTWISEQQIYEFHYTYPNPIKNTSQYKIYYWIKEFQMAGSIELAFFNIRDISLNNNRILFSFSLMGNTHCNLFINPTAIWLQDLNRGKNMEMSESKFWIYELEDSMDPMPTPIPPAPIINKKIYYNDTKLRWNKRRKKYE